jgi:energy-coupling factor transporter ATP-binding protein EcfA2
MSFDYEKNSLAVYWLRGVRNRLISKKLNKNWLAIVTGETGSGKSYSALSLANWLSRRHYHVVFTSKDFLTLLNSGLLRKGHVVIFDEAGVGMSSRDWYTVQNKILGAVLQTFRNLNIGVIFTVPNMSFIDSQARKLFHHYFETSHIDYEHDVAYLKVYEIQYNGKYDKCYFKHPKVNYGGKLIKFNKIGILKPSKNLILKYEKQKHEYTKALNKDAEDVVRKVDEPKQERKAVDVKGIAQEIINQKEKYLGFRKGKAQIPFIIIERIEENYKIGHNKARIIKQIAERTLFT